MARDHRNADQKVKELAKEQGIALSRPEPRNQQEKQMMQKRKDLASKLKSASPSEFDKMYLEATQKGHQHSIQMLKSAELKNQAASELVNKLFPILEQHLALAKHIDHEVTKGTILQLPSSSPEELWEECLRV